MKGHFTPHSEETKLKISNTNKINPTRFWLGKKFSQKHKDNLKKASIGKIPWNKNKKGCMPPAWNKGIKIDKNIYPQMGHNKIHSQDSKIKISIAKIGKPSHWRGKKNIKIMGEKNYNWKGGISPLSEKIRKSFVLQDWRVRVFQRDNYVCKMPDCDRSEHYLQAHHIKPFAIFSDLRTVLSNGITLCKNCHRKTYKKEDQFEKLFQSINTFTAGQLINMAVGTTTTASGAIKATCTIRVTETI